MKKSSGTLVCPWPECIFRSLLQFLVLTLGDRTLAPFTNMVSLTMAGDISLSLYDVYTGDDMW